MINLNTLLFIGAVAVSIAIVLPMGIPLVESFMHAMELVPLRY